MLSNILSLFMILAITNVQILKLQSTFQMPEKRHKCSQSDLLGMFYKHPWNKPAKEQTFPSHLNSWSWFCFQKMEHYNCFERSESPLWDGDSFSEASPLFDIFSKKWQAFGECGQRKWCASSKEQGFFLEWACCPEARLICILSAVHLSFTCKAVALPASAWIQPCPREGLRPWTSKAI